jgi:FkbM family methyltransferase
MGDCHGRISPQGKPFLRGGAMLKSATQKFLSAFGYKLAPIERFSPSWNLVHFFPMLRRFGFSPKQIWDVGANRGNWTRQAIGYFPDAEYTLLEPQESMLGNLDDLIRAGHKIRWINAGAGAKAATLPFYIHPQDAGSSFLPLPRITQEAVRRVDVPVRTLNEIRETLSLPIPEMLKIDAEGLDLKVLEGASDFLGTTEIILLEVSIGQLDFENDPQIVIEAMYRYGYRLIDITDVNRGPTHGVLWLCEFAFLRKASTLLDGANRY